MTEEKVNAIVSDYKNPEIKVQDIYKKYSLNGTTLGKILRENNVSNRCPNKTGSRAKTIKKRCSKCHRTIELKGARFCPYCGADIRSEKDLTIEKANKLFSMCCFLPESQRDEAQNTIRQICDYLSRKDV